MKLRALLPFALLSSACAHRFDPGLAEAPIAGRSWVSTEQREHPLVGKIWDARAGRFVDEAALATAVTSADFVALGEVHDNPDHHLLQVRLLRAIIASGRRPALGFEMLEVDQQKAVDASLAAAPKDPDALGKAVGWERSGWPEFGWYRPLFAAGLEAGLPVVAANLSRAQLREVRKKGREALDEGVRVRLARDEPLPQRTLKSLRTEMAESHCGELPEAMVDPLVLAQRARDAVMAARLGAAGAERGGVLITGNQHARTDRGVPAVLAKDAPAKRIVAVSFTEVHAGATEPAAYREEEVDSAPLPWDFVVFTPGAKREDPCIAFRAHMKKRAEAAAQEAAKPPPADANQAPPAAAPPAAPPAR